MAHLIRYGLQFASGTSDFEVEKYMIRQGGQWKGKQGQTIGKGMFWHYRQAQMVLWPTEKKWHYWNELQLDEWLKHRAIGVMGPASSGKTCSGATDHLVDYYCWPECTTVLICSTTRDRLEDRIWGEIKKYHRLAKHRFPELPGNLIEGKQRIVTDGRNESIEGRDFRNGIVGVACMDSSGYKGLSSFIGIKNARVRLAADELQLLPQIFVFSVSNLDKNPDFKVSGYGNPKETTDALGTLCEPTDELGGWESGIDQSEKTKTWPTRFGGIALQLVGTDSPNLDGKLGIPLITQEAIDRDVERYGKESLQFTMMNQGMMPRGQGSRRVITKQLCRDHRAFDDAEWLDSNRKKIAMLDAAYGGVGGDRCMFGTLEFGYEAETIEEEVTTFNVANQKTPPGRHRQIMALTRMTLVPLNVKLEMSIEDQITLHCKQQCELLGIPPEDFFFDAGMRTSLVTSMSRIWSPQVSSIDFGGRPSDRPVGADIQVKEGGRDRPKRCSEHYQKFVTELWFSSRLIIEAGQFRGMTDSVCNEGSQREWTVVGMNKIEVEPKAKMKEKIGRSPDMYDCLCCGIEGARRRGFNIAGLQAPKEPNKRNTSQWKRDLEEKSRAGWQEAALDYDA